MSVAKSFITKICNFCNQEFQAQKRTTKFCGLDCARRAYKHTLENAKNKDLDGQEAIKQAVVKTNILLESINKTIKDMTRQLDLHTKTYLTPMEVCSFLKFSRKSFDRLVKSGTLKTHRLGAGKLYVKRSDIDHYFYK
mgnify:CR=1 FL=1